jgi:hypothetical protein
VPGEINLPDITESGESSMVSLDTKKGFKTPPRVETVKREPPPVVRNKSISTKSKALDSDDSDDSCHSPPVKLKKDETKTKDEVPKQSNFSELRYLETKGIAKFLKGSRARVTNDDEHHDEAQSILKISYRINSLNDEIQFALVIYEKCVKSVKTRRNLMSEFSEHGKKPDKSAVTRRPRTPDSPRKRSLRF